MSDKQTAPEGNRHVITCRCGHVTAWKRDDPKPSVCGQCGFMFVWRPAANLFTK